LPSALTMALGKDPKFAKKNLYFVHSIIYISCPT